MLGWLGRMLGGRIVETAGDVGETYLEQRGESERAETTAEAATEISGHRTSVALNAARSWWRPIWMVALIACTVAYVVASIWFFRSWWGGITTAEVWALDEGVIAWRLGWTALGASIFGLATVSFLGFSPFRSSEKILGVVDGAGSVPTTPAGRALRQRLAGSTTPPVREPLPPTAPLEQHQGEVVRRPGVVVPKRAPRAASSLDMRAIRDRIIKDEGIRYEIYPDYVLSKEAGRPVAPTAGVGHLITAADGALHGAPFGTKVSKAQVGRWLASDLESAVTDARAVLPSFDAQPPAAREVLVNQAFQLGRTKLAGFVRMLAALARRDYRDAAAEALDSKAARQTPKRWRRHARRLRTLA